MIRQKTAKGAFGILLCLVLSLAFFVQAITVNGQNAADGYRKANDSSYAGSVTNVTGQFDSIANNYLQSDNSEGMPLASDEVTVIIRLQDAPLIERLNTVLYPHISDYALSSEGKSYESMLRHRQTELKNRLAKDFSIEFEDGFTTLINGLVAKIKYGDFARLKEYSGVHKLMLSPQYAAPSSDTIVNPVNVYASGIYDSSDVDYDGSGTIVGIFDTGLDYTHPAFQHMPDQLALDKNRLANVLDQTYAARGTAGLIADDVYLNDKVPFAYDYADQVPEVYPNSTHGTHVAGIVAGKDDSKILDNGESFIGVAPNAQLAIFKVFSSNKDTADMDVILRGLTDAVLLKLDVVNLSLGAISGFSSSDDDSQTDEIYESLRQAGISIVVSAGNEGSSAAGSAKGGTNQLTNPDSGTIGSPGAFRNVLTVASIDGEKSDYFISDNGVTGYIYNSTDSKGNRLIFVEKMFEIMRQRGVSELPYVTVPGVGRPANYMTVDAKDKIALVKRGSIDFADKIKYAEQQGAIGIIIYNNVSGVINIAAGKSVGIPSSSITMDIGEQLASQESGMLKFDAEYKAGPFISGFSAWGVTPDLELKPEITAHGGNILSAVPGGYESISGTSMSAPNLAGAMTIVRQYIKDKHPEIESLVELNKLANRLMMSTATIAKNEQGNPYSPRKQGAGLASLYNTINANAYLYVDGTDKTKISTGDDVEKTGVYSLTFRIKNMSATAMSYKMSADVFTESISSDKTTVQEKAYMFEDSELTYSSPNAYIKGDYVTVSGYGDVEVTAKVELSQDAKDYLDAGFVNGMYVEGFIKLTPFNAGDIELSVPWVSFYGDWTQAPVFDITAYEEAESARDISVVDKDKVTPDVYPSIPMGSFYITERDGDPLRGYWGLGKYMFTTERESDAPLPYEDKSAISTTPGAVDELSYVGLGTLRAAKTADYKVVNELTGEVVDTGQQLNLRKSIYSGGQRQAGSVLVELGASSFGLKENNKYSIQVDAKLDYRDGGVNTNVNNTFKSIFYVDSDAPILDKGSMSLRIEERNKVKRYYLDMDVYDNHYLQAMMLLTYSDIVDNTLTDMTTFGNYMIPIESKRNETTKISYEITDYWNLIRKNDNKIYFEITDYAKNTAAYLIELPQAASEGITFVEPTRNIDIDQTLDLKNDLEMTPSNAWIYDLNWSSSDNSVATVSSDGIVTGKKEGTAKITAAAKGSDVKGELTVNVSDKVYIPKLEKLVLDKVLINAIHGETGFISVDVVPYNFECTPEWTSSASDIVKVEAVAGTNGRMAKYTVLKESSGGVNIWVSDKSSTLISSSCQVNIKPLFRVQNAVLTGYFGQGDQDGVVDIPEDLDIIYIAENAFSENPYVKKVIVPEGVKAIGMYSFDKCENLTEVVLPESCGIIETAAFDGCSDLTTINLGHVKTINRYAFRGTRLSSVDFSSADFIGMGAFSILNGADVGTFSVADLSNVKYIGAEAFGNCYNLTDVTIAAETIEMAAFAGCTKLERVTFLNKVTIQPMAFYMCERLKEVNFQKGAVSIGAEAFAHCNSLTSFMLPEGLEILGGQAFINCSNLTNVTISAKTPLSNLGANIFAGTKVSAFNVENGNSSFVVHDGILYESGRSKLLLYPYAKPFNDGHFIVPAGVTEIGSFAFSGMPALVSINLNEVQTISRGAFYSCTSLETISGTSRLENIGADAFSECSKVDLSFINSANSLISIGDRAFYLDQSSASQILRNLALVLPSSIEDVGEFAFGNVHSIINVDISNTALTEISGFVFFGCEKLTDIRFSNKIERLGDGVFARCNSLVTIVLPDSITEIGIGLFNLSRSLKYVTLPKNITEIPSFMFTSTAIETMVLPEGVTYIGDSAFFGCNNFIGFANGMSSLEYISDHALAYTAIEEFDAPNVTYVGQGFIAHFDPTMGEYSDNESLKYVNLPNLLYLGNYAFVACTALESVNIPKAEYIGLGAFMYSGIKNIELRGAKNVGELVFYDSMIENITFTADSVNLKDYTLLGTSSIKSIALIGEGKYFLDGGVLYSVLQNGGYQLEKYPSLKTDQEKYTVLEGTVRIASEAFFNNKTLVEVTLPRTLLAIGDGAFAETSITTYVFTSPQMPALEGMIDLYTDPVTMYNSVYVAYRNFQRNYLEAEGLTIVKPSNGSGYDSSYIVNKFFATVQDGAKALFDSTVEVINLIDGIPQAVKLGDRAAIEAAREAYKNLIPDQQALVGNYIKLTSAEQVLSGLIVSDMIDRINKLPTNVTASDKELVEKLSEDFEKLTDSQKQQIVNLSKLQDALEKINKKDEGISVWVWVGLGAGIVVLAAGIVILVMKKGRRKNEAK